MADGIDDLRALRSAKAAALRGNGAYRENWAGFGAGLHEDAQAAKARILEQDPTVIDDQRPISPTGKRTYEDFLNDAQQGMWGVGDDLQAIDEMYDMTVQQMQDAYALIEGAGVPQEGALNSPTPDGRGPEVWLGAPNALPQEAGGFNGIDLNPAFDPSEALNAPFLRPLGEFSGMTPSELDEKYGVASLPAIDESSAGMDTGTGLSADDPDLLPMGMDTGTPLEISDALMPPEMAPAEVRQAVEGLRSAEPAADAEDAGLSEGGLFAKQRNKLLGKLGIDDEDGAQRAGMALLGFGSGLLTGGSDFGAAMGNGFAKGVGQYVSTKKDQLDAGLAEAKADRETQRLDMQRETFNDRKAQASLERLNQKNAALGGKSTSYLDGNELVTVDTPAAIFDMPDKYDDYEKYYFHFRQNEGMTEKEAVERAERHAGIRAPKADDDLISGVN